MGKLLNQKSDGRHGSNPGDEVTPQAGSQAGLSVSLDIRDDGILLHINGIPDGASLECLLNDAPLSPCHDGALLARPATGNYKIKVVARRDGGVVNLGETPTFSVNPSVGGTVGSEVGVELVLEQSDPEFVNGMAIVRDQIKTFTFKLRNPAPCDSPQFRCRYDSRTSNFWTNCDSGKASYTLPKGVMALGLQYLSVQAACPLQVGPELTYFWYGVPSGYEPLMLASVKDSTSRYVLNLVKADDCPEGDQKFECAQPGQTDQWSLCQQTENANVFDNPQDGFRVRLACGDKKGPVFTFRKE
jgi:hypothetical protein